MTNQLRELVADAIELIESFDEAALLALDSDQHPPSSLSVMAESLKVALATLPKERARPKANEVARIGDMHTQHALRVGLDGDADVYLSTTDGGGNGVEFCTTGNGGGKSPRTRDALIALMVAMEADNADDPRRDWWLQRNTSAALRTPASEGDDPVDPWEAHYQITPASEGDGGRVVGEIKWAGPFPQKPIQKFVEWADGIPPIGTKLYTTPPTQQEARKCRNCGGIDPASCAFNCQQEARAVDALREVRRWIGDGDMGDGMHRSIWTPAYAELVDMVDAVLAGTPAKLSEEALARASAAAREYFNAQMRFNPNDIPGAVAAALAALHPGAKP